MSKLYATLSNSAGKQVSISSNERIEATVYEGNKKQYSVYIDWCDIGDIIDNYGNDLPESEKKKGSIVTVKEWRNEPDNCETCGAKLKKSDYFCPNKLCKA